MLAGSGGLLAEDKSPYATTTDALNSGLKHLEKNSLADVKKAYMHLFVHDRTASGLLMKAMKSWVEKRRAQPSGTDAASIDAFDAWVRERDALAASVVNLGHNSPDWK
jgi:hypothetical protein